MIGKQAKKIIKDAKEWAKTPRYEGISYIPAFNMACVGKCYTKEEISEAFGKFIPKDHYTPGTRKDLINYAKKMSG